MKKSLKLFLVILLVLVVAFAVTGCGKKNEENNANTATTENSTKAENNETKTESTSSKTVNALSKLQGDYVMALEGKTEEDGEEITMSMTIATKGENIYADVKAEDEHATIIYKDGTTYLIAHDEKMYMTQEGKEEDAFSDMTFITKEDLDEIKKEECKTGKETIEGTEYDYEEYTDSKTNEVERFYFTGDELRYIKAIGEDGNEELMKVNTLSSDVDDSLFEIPADYQKVEL